MSFDTLPQLCIPGWNQAGLCEWIESPSRERIYSYCFSLHILLSEDNKSAIGFAETTLTTAREFRHKADEGKDLASLRQLGATTGSRARTAGAGEGTEQRLCLNHIALLAGAGGGLGFQSSHQTSRQLSAFMVG